MMMLRQLTDETGNRKRTILRAVQVQVSRLP